MAGGIVAALSLAEFTVRLAGHEPWQSYREMAGDAFVRMRTPDPKLGWRNLPGTYRSQRNSVSILADGARKTTGPSATDAPEVWLIGGSFIYGQGISDEQTLASALAARDPQRRYRNFGVSGFGTYQSLLLLEELLADNPPPQTVVYGLIDHHAIRNIGRGLWLRAISRLAISEYPLLPYCSLDADGKLVRHPAEAYPRTPLREHSALVELLERTYAEWRSQHREPQREQVTELLLTEMQDLCRRHGMEFLSVLLDDGEPGAPSWIVDSAHRRQIPFADCRTPLTPERRVPIDNHPNDVVHRLWADCLAEPLGLDSPR